MHFCRNVIVFSSLCLLSIAILSNIEVEGCICCTRLEQMNAAIHLTIHLSRMESGPQSFVTCNNQVQNFVPS